MVSSEKGYKKLVAWQKADELAYSIYLSTKTFPPEELYGLTSQLRRASTSIPTNIAEGMGRQNKKETKQFINIALGSMAEVEYLLSFCHKVGLLSETEYEHLETERQNAGNILYGLYRSFP